MRYTQLKSLLLDTILAPHPKYAGIEIVPGTDEAGTANHHIVLTPTPAPGLAVEGLIDAVGWQVEAVGDQNDYGDAEDLAFIVDTGLLKIHSGTHSGNWVVGIDRVGSPPVPLLVDDADRTHFVCSYIATVKSALA